MKKIENVYILGNGFDRHHGLKTNYSDFKDFLYTFNPEIIDKFDSLLADHCIKEDKIKKWSELESYLGVISDVDYDSLHDSVFDNAESDLDRASYWSDPEYIADNQTRELSDIILFLKSHLKQWIDSIVIDKRAIVPDLHLDREAYYLSFNYTQTAEIIYGIDPSHVLHIHSASGEYVLGHNQAIDPPYKEVYDTYLDDDGNPASDTDYREARVREIMNGTNDVVYRAYFKDSERIIQLHKTWLSVFSKAKRIVFMGFGFGTEDLIYLSYVFHTIEGTPTVEVYYHEDDELLRIKAILKGYAPLCSPTLRKW